MTKHAGRTIGRRPHHQNSFWSYWGLGNGTLACTRGLEVKGERFEMVTDHTARSYTQRPNPGVTKADSGNISFYTYTLNQGHYCKPFKVVSGL